jgi:type IV secretion system protein VirB2
MNHPSLIRLIRLTRLQWPQPRASGLVFPLKEQGALRRRLAAAAATVTVLASQIASAAGFDKVSTTVTNVNAILVTISVAVVTIAIIWAGFKMIFQGARLADVANVLLGGTLVGGAAAFASYIVT